MKLEKQKHSKAAEYYYIVMGVAINCLHVAMIIIISMNIITVKAILGILFLGMPFSTAHTCMH